MLAAHDAETINFHKSQKKLGTQVNRMRYERYVTSLDGLPIRASPPEEVGSFGASETVNAQRSGNGVSRDQGLPPV